MHWLLNDSLKRDLDQARQRNESFSVEQKQAFEARLGEAEGGSKSRIMSIGSGQAVIRVQGVLTKHPDIFAYFFGGGNTTYTEIVAALAEAEVNDDVNTVVIEMDSGGGAVDGMFDTIAALQKFPKPLECHVSGMCASAAYGLASQCDKITAGTKADMIGSIGVVQTHYVSENIVDVTSTNAPKKRPDVSTPEGKAAVVEQLDALHDLFVEAIAGGRGKTEDQVNAEFGQGAVLVASDALKRGMIDGIGAVESVESNTAGSGGIKHKASIMDIEKLKAQHPDVYAAVVQVGVDQERDRVSAHLIMGEETGAMDVASAAIQDGSDMTAKLTAKYATAGMNRQDMQKREKDDPNAGTPAAPAASEHERDEEVSANILKAAAEGCGVELEV